MGGVEVILLREEGRYGGVGSCVFWGVIFLFFG